MTLENGILGKTSYPMPIRKRNKVTERAGVNFVQSVVESNSSIFKEIAQQHDYGHDAFILLTEDGNTPLFRGQQK